MCKAYYEIFLFDLKVKLISYYQSWLCRFIEPTIEFVTITTNLGVRQK